MKLEILDTALGVWALRLVIRRYRRRRTIRDPSRIVLANHGKKAGRAARVVKARKAVTRRVDLVIMLAKRESFELRKKRFVPRALHDFDVAGLALCGERRCPRLL